MKYLIVLIMSVPCISEAQERPGLFFREDFKETPAVIPVSQDDVSNTNLLISLYGSSADQIKKSHHEKPADDPYYVWSGLCTGDWAVTFKHKSQLVDLSRQGKVRWRSKQSGLRQLHIVLKLADGSWLVSEDSDPLSMDWRVKEFNIQDLKWWSLDIETMVEKKFVDNPDLSKVAEIGFTDLMKGGGSNACSRVDWIEVDGFQIRNSER
ncbi:MAG: hypothetical protein DHS20C17_24400 [Cyclobacteriaceae bacterium]|nr:MAG: hypothetical protein DHS20C17_24400 [Cyclobacteriaceae bacterium]